MKIRQTLNNNADHFIATAYEKSGKILVVKKDAFNYYDNSTDETYEFSTVSEYENWKAGQDWIVPSKTHTICPFQKVAE